MDTLTNYSTHDLVTEIRRRGNAVALWQPEDIIDLANENGYTIDEEEAKEILQEIDDKQDCSVGITWDTLEIYLEDYVD